MSASVSTSDLLPELLQSIGAAPLDPLVAIRTGEAHIAGHVAHLEGEKRNAEAAIHATVKKQWPRLEEQWKTGNRLDGRINTQEQELSDLEHELDDPQSGVLPTLTAALSAHAALLTSHSHSSALLTALSSLSPIFTSLSKLSSLLRTEDPASLVEGVSVLTRLRDDVLRLINPELAGDKAWVAESELAKRARAQTEELGEETRQRLLDAVRTAVTVLPDAEGTVPSSSQAAAHHGVAVRRILASRESSTSRAVTWSDALEALGRISPADVDREVAKSAHLVVREIAAPICDPGSDIRLRKHSLSDQSAELRLAPLEASAANADAPLRKLDDLRTLLATLAEALPFKAYLRLLHAHLLPQLEALIISPVLSSALPSSPTDSTALSHWSSRIYPAARHFSATTLGRQTPLSTPAPTPDGRLKPQSLVRWLDTVGHQWGLLLASQALDSARKDMVRCKWEGVQMEWELPPEPVRPVSQSPPRTQPRPAPKPMPSAATTATGTEGSFHSLFDFESAVSPSPSASFVAGSRSSSPSGYAPLPSASVPASGHGERGRPRSSLSLSSASRGRSDSSAQVPKTTLPKELFTPSPSPSPPLPSAVARSAEVIANVPDNARKPTLPPMSVIKDEPTPNAPDEGIDWDMGFEAPPPPSIPQVPPSPTTKTQQLQASSELNPPPNAEQADVAPEEHDEGVDWDIGFEAAPPPPARKPRPSSPPLVATEPPSTHRPFPTAPMHPPARPTITAQRPSQLSISSASFRSSFVTPEPTEGEEAGEDDAWGLDEAGRVPNSPEKPQASSASPTLKQRSSPVSAPQTNGTTQKHASTAPSVPSIGTTESFDDEGGAWGFGEEEEDEATEEPAKVGEPSSLSPPARKVQPTVQNGTAAFSKTPAIEANPSKDSNVSPEVDDGADGWGFGDEEDDEAGLQAATMSSPLRLRGGAAAEGDAWGWDEEEEDEDAIVEAQLRGAAPSAPQPASVAGKSQTPATNGKPRKESMTVSKLAVALLDNVRQLLQQAQRVAEPSFESRELAPSAPILTQTAFDLFDLFAALMPVQHSQLLDTVPSLGMQFANDCDWLAKQAREVKKSERAEHTAKRFESLGKLTRDRQVELQRAALFECLEEAEGFRDTGEAARFAACERALRQVIHILERIAQAWKPVMLPSTYTILLGELVDAILKRILADIEAQPDIGEVESHQLNTLCKSLHGLESLFQSNGTSTIGRHVPCWFKFSFLSELLEASMADIMWMHQEGMLSEYSDMEVVELVRALFSDSPMRSKNIDKILSSSA